MIPYFKRVLKIILIPLVDFTYVFLAQRLDRTGVKSVDHLHSPNKGILKSYIYSCVRKG